MAKNRVFKIDGQLAEYTGFSQVTNKHHFSFYNGGTYSADTLEGMEEVKTVDCTPTWEGIHTWLIAAIEDGNTEGQKVAKAELRKMAKAADLSNRFLNYIKYTDTVLEAKEMPLTFDKWEEWTKEQSNLPHELKGVTQQ